MINIFRLLQQVKRFCMLQQLNKNPIESDILKNCEKLIDGFNQFKTSINVPTGNFFYDKWILREEFRGTAFETALKYLGENIGQARIISLESQNCYTKHADIDDRYHLNISGDNGYLADLDHGRIFPTVCDGLWYIMDAGRLHTAFSCGEAVRHQLVVRKLLNKNILQNPVTVTITIGGVNPRFKFDNHISPWLNRANKSGLITNFSAQSNQESVTFDVEETSIKDLEKNLPKDFEITYEHR
jgi:hypothetical protein